MKLQITSFLLFLYVCKTITCVNCGKKTTNQQHLPHEQRLAIPNLKQISQAEAEDIIKQYYPDNEIRNLRTHIDLPETVEKFNEYVGYQILRMDFREYVALSSFKQSGHELLYDTARDFAYQSFEMANALLSVGERSGLTQVIRDKVLKPGRSSVNEEDFILTSQSLWRGEVRARSDINHFINTGQYSTGNRFVSFSRSKDTALDFVTEERIDNHETRVLYEFKAATKYHRLDFKSVNFNMDSEEEVVLYPNMDIKIIDSTCVRDEVTRLKYRYIRMLHTEMINNDEWEQTKYDVLSEYFNRAQEIQPFSTKAELPKPPTPKQSLSTLESDDSNCSPVPFKRMKN